MGDGAGKVLAAVRDWLTAVGSPEVGEFMVGLDWDMPERQLSPRGLACLRHLERAAEISAARERHAALALASAATKLHWGQTYTAGDFGQNFIDNYGWVELFGTRGHFVSERLAGGFLLLGPQVLYSDHHHLAEEIYIPLTGGTLWKMGDAPMRKREGGEVIFHASNVNHAMQTREEPLLAFYLWRGGDLAQRSVIGGRGA